MEQTLAPGLYIVATPIGNLGDITFRAAETLKGCEVVACEDTRVTGKLMNHLGSRKKLMRYDDHAGDDVRERLLALMETVPVALVSDAGTPLISDPGYRLVRDARERGIAITSLPGPNAAVVAMTLSGLPNDRFLFAGFLPNKAKAREDTLQELAGIRATLIFYETAPRLDASLTAIDAILPGREVSVAREITKKFEECRTGLPLDLARHYAENPPKGEIVLLIGPPTESAGAALDEEGIDALLRAELAGSKPSQAAGKVAKATGLDRKMLYARAMELK